MRRLWLGTLLFLLSLAYGGRTLVFVWDKAGEGARFRDPDGRAAYITPAMAYNHALFLLDSLIDATEVPAHDTLRWIVDDELPPGLLDSFNVVIATFGWPGSGAQPFTAEEQEIIVEFLLSNAMVPGGQRAFIAEGNNFAGLYCSPSTPESLRQLQPFLCVSYLGTTPAPSLFRGQANTFAEGLTFQYVHDSEPGGPDTTCDDMGIIDTMVWSSHASYVFFGGGVKDPARGILRRSYSPGACLLLSFCFGNLRDGAFPNTKVELLKRILDYAIPPLGWFTDDFLNKTFCVNESYPIVFKHYDNFVVKDLSIEYSTDGGVTWTTIYSVRYPSDEDTVFWWVVPPPASEECRLRITTTDEAYNVCTQTSGFFEVSFAFGADDAARSALPLWLSQARPNPFNSVVRFSAVLRDGGEVSVCGLDGRRLRRLFAGKTGETLLNLTWDGADQDGKPLPSGVYIIKARSQRGEVVARPVLLVR